MRDADPTDDPPTTVLLWWIPVGAGGHVVRRTSRWWELLHARRSHRPPRQLFHAALEVRVDGSCHVIEMAPAWGGPRAADRGVVCTGPVGLAFLGRSRFFRYEVRCWRGGTIPDRDWALGGPTLLAESPGVARAVLDQAPRVPALTWGRTVPSTGEMWNSNSLIAWLLCTSGIDTANVFPPQGGWAPGWSAGLAIGADPTLLRGSGM